MAPIIKVKLPPSSSPMSHTDHSNRSSLSSAYTSKKDETTLTTSTNTQSIIPCTPKRQSTSTHHPPSRRNNKRSNTQHAGFPTSTPNSPSPVRKLKGKSPRLKKNILVTSLDSSSSSSSLKILSTSANERVGIESRINAPSPLSKRNTTGKINLKGEKIKRMDLLDYEDPLLSTRSNTLEPNPSSSSPIIFRTLESSEKPSSTSAAPTTLLPPSTNESRIAEQNQEEQLKLVVQGNKDGEGDGRCDDSGCDIDWEDSFYSSRNRTCSDSSIFTSITTSSFTSSTSSTNEASRIQEDSTLLFNHVNQSNDAIFTPTITESFPRQFNYADRDGVMQEGEKTSPTSPTISPASSRSSFCLHNAHSSPSSDRTFEKDLLLSEKFPSFHVSNTFTQEVSSVSLFDTNANDSKQEEEEDNDFPLLMLEKNIRGLIDEAPSNSNTSFSIFPTPPLRDSSKKQTIISPITTFSCRQRLHGFTGISPLPQTHSNTFINALESFENKLELSKKVSYPFLSSSTSSSIQSLSSSKSMDAFIRNGDELLTSKNGNAMQERMRANTLVSEFPTCRCGCGEREREQEGHSFLTSNASSPFYDLKGARTFPKSPFSKEVEQEKKAQLEFNKTELKNKNVQHKSIWSISSPPISPIKQNNLSNYRSGFMFEGEVEDPLKIEYGMNNTSTYLPSEDHTNSYHHQLQSSIFGIIPSSTSPLSGSGLGKPTLKRAVSSHLPLTSHGDYPQDYVDSFEYDRYGPSSPYPYAHHYGHANSYSAPPRHAHPYNHYGNQQQYNNYYCHQRMIHQPQGPSPNNKKGELYKTELCKSWSEIGNCRYGEKCQFAHGLIELRNFNNNMNHTVGNYSNERYYHREHSISMSPYSNNYNNNYKFPFSPSPLNSEYKKHHFDMKQDNDIIGNKRMEGGLQPLIETRRRSVSSPSKIRMYGLSQSTPSSSMSSNLKGERDYSLWNDSDIFNIGKDRTPYTVDDDGDIFGHFSPCPQDLKSEKKFSPFTEKSLFDTLQAEAADAPIPTLEIATQ